MRLLLEEDLAPCMTLDEVQMQAQATFAALRADGFDLGYIAGPVSCDGEDLIQTNLGLLVEARTRVMYGLGERTLTLTAPFIFTGEMYARLGLFEMARDEREENMGRFWDELLESGHIGTVLFRQGWERSPGSRRERATASRIGTRIIDLDF